MIVGIHQPNYLPWLGYFRKISHCDVFVFYDNVQMPGGKSYISRNAVKTASGRQWLTVPVTGRSGFPPIHSVKVAESGWVRKHLRTIEVNYSNASWKHLSGELLAPVLEAEESYISTLNIALIQTISVCLELADVKFVRASEMDLSSQGAASIPEILKILGASTYVTGRGSGTKRHLDQEALQAMGIDTQYLPDEFPEYQQCHGEFLPKLSVVDALLNIGPLETRRLLQT